MSTNTCRFCGGYEIDRNVSDRMVKYGTRHYAHHRCYLAAGKPLTELHDWQVVDFPYRLLQEFGFNDYANAAYEREVIKTQRAVNEGVEKIPTPNLPYR
jgi:hypothetical protein